MVAGYILFQVLTNAFISRTDKEFNRKTFNTIRGRKSRRRFDVVQPVPVFNPGASSQSFIARNRYVSLVPVIQDKFRIL